MSDLIDRLNAALEGRYRIEREVGEGGMATVYLADDLKHERKVALKVLKPDLAAVVGAERFLTEIKTTATLHHPNILPLFDSGEADGFLFYVMPYIEGETLRDRIQRERQLPVDQAVSIVVAVANALQHAHDRGVIHRDIKPGNILLQDGQPLVADFGIALAVGVAGGSRLTETGLSVGTPYYMAPEQATGDQAIGPQSDVYALAAVLFEMLVGDPPYMGSTAQAVLGKILQGTPVSATAARRAVPPNVDAAIRKALEKLPADRFTGAQDFARALSDPGFRYAEEGTVVVAAAGPWKAVSVALGAGLLASLAWTFLRPEPSPVPAFHVLSAQGWEGLSAAIGRRAALAPDGSSMVLPIMSPEGVSMLGFKLRGSPDVEPLAGTEDARDVAFSPDGRSIAYVVGTELRTQSLAGGGAVTLARDLEAGNRTALDWLDDESILYEQQPGGQRQISRIPPTGGDAIQIVLPAAAVSPIWVRGLPGGRGALVIYCEPVIVCTGSQSRLSVIDFTDLSQHPILEHVLAAWYVPTGHIVYAQADGSVLAQGFDLSTLAVEGGPIPLFPGVRTGGNWADMRLGADGTLLYVEGPAAGDSGREVMFVDRTGEATPVDPRWPRGLFAHLALSPDDRMLAVTMNTANTGTDLWVKALPDGPFTALATDSANASGPEWSPDGSTVAYATTLASGGELRTVRSDGSAVGQYTTLLRREAPLSQMEFVGDAGGYVFREDASGTTGNSGEMGIVREAGAEPELLFTSPNNEQQIAVSDDGEWLAYVSGFSGRNEVYVRPLSDPLAYAVTVSTNGAVAPVWAHNGRELFYVENTTNTMMVATYGTQPRFSVEARTPMFSVAGFQSSAQAVDVTNDDQRFVMIRNLDLSAEAVGRIILVENWFEWLKERLGS